MIRSIITSFFIFLTWILSAQINTTVQDLYWVKYGAKTSISEDWKVSLSAEDRRYVKYNRQHMWLFTAGVSRKVSESWTLGGGLTKWTILMPSDPDSKFHVTQEEWRPFIFATHKKTVTPKLDLSQRINVEQRFRENVSTNPLNGAPVIESGYYTYTRLRLLGNVTFKLAEEAKIPVSATVYNEFMIHFGDDSLSDLFDQNRLGAYFTFDILKSTSLAIGYTNWFQRRANEGDFFLRHIAMFYVTQQF